MGRGRVILLKEEQEEGASRRAGLVWSIWQSRLFWNEACFLPAPARKPQCHDSVHVSNREDMRSWGHKIETQVTDRARATEEKIEEEEKN